MEITKREIIASIAIAAVMMTAGFVISGKVTDYRNDKNAEYQKAAQIEDSELFQYGMDTNVGNAFIYGDVEPVDIVTFDEIGGEYLHVEKIEERYERHEKWETEKDEDGEEHREKKVWYEWETEDSEERHAEEIMFCGVVFSWGKIVLPDDEYIGTVEGDKVWSLESGEYVEVRFKYYGVATNYTGTVYTRLANKTISDGSRFYKDCTIEQALEICTAGTGIASFWIGWVLFTAACVVGFCYMDNRWLES